MKKYQKPSCTVLHIKTDSAILYVSLVGAEIGGVTNRFNIRERLPFDDEDEWE